MERVIRNVAELDVADRRAIEHLLGRQLERNQQLVISVVSLDLSDPDAPALPWEGVYAGLPEEEVERLDGAIRRRADLSRDAG